MNPAISTIIETLGKDGILAIRPVQASVLEDAERIEGLAKAARPRTTIRRVHQSAAATLRTIALDSRFFLDHSRAMEDIEVVRKAHERFERTVSRSGAIDRKSLSLFAGLDITVWNLIASRYPDEEGIRA